MLKDDKGWTHIRSVADAYGLRVNASEATVDWKVRRRPTGVNANYDLDGEERLVAPPHDEVLKRKVYLPAD